MACVVADVGIGVPASASLFVRTRVADISASDEFTKKCCKSAAMSPAVE